jgi:hypothetical protein
MPPFMIIKLKALSNLSHNILRWSRVLGVPRLQVTTHILPNSVSIPNSREKICP